MARGHLRWSVRELADKSGVSVATIKRMEEVDGVPNSLAGNLAALKTTLESAGVIFVAENGEGPGVRLKKERP